VRCSLRRSPRRDWAAAVTFTTFTFVVFLLIVFALYWWRPDRRRQNVLLLMASYVFYGWWDWRFCSLMLLSSLLDYWAGLSIERLTTPAFRRAVLAATMASNLLILGIFKYFNFFAENLQALAASFGWQMDSITLRIVLPVGVSFYTFQSMSYTIDVYRRHLKPTADFVDYMTFVTFFPQLVAGPIERATHLLPQFMAPRRFDPGAAADGSRQMLWGFFKKMVLADNLGPIVTAYYTHPERATGPELMFGTLCFAFQIYCDFSAYSDIAVGSAKWFGIDIMRNFAYPYFSQDIVEFWRRWHISLSTWFRDYVYVPLGGRRTGGFGHGIWNLMVTFVLSGLWHGASWTFVAWGALNGAAIVATVWRGGVSLRPTDTPGGLGLIPRATVAIRILATFVFVCVTWVLFRALSLSDALLILHRMVADSLSLAAWRTLGVVVAATYSRPMELLLAFVLLEWVTRRHPHPLHVGAWPRWLRWMLYTLVIWIILFYGTHSPEQFIYFQF
jgi:alginate O-acetyltransferase complex protein AlgI